MKINQYQLTYCTNIHPGEHWEEVFSSLKEYTLAVKKRIASDKPFGIGLRLSRTAATELLIDDSLTAFKEWLSNNELYVFTLNGFPYGNFHRQKVKDFVHQPDWTTKERVNYTLDLFHILSELLPSGMEGGISTSPISYRPWFENKGDELSIAYKKACQHLAEVVAYLYNLENEKACFMHLDLEPEPDGFLENTEDVLRFYKSYLVPVGIEYLEQKLSISMTEAEGIIKRHIQICYDVCHFSLMYEHPKDTFTKWASDNIQIGKIQLSAALRAIFSDNAKEKNKVIEALGKFNEPIYLHQVIAKDKQDKLHKFSDLPEALPVLEKGEYSECSVHFHVPLFLEKYQLLESTQAQIIQVLDILAYENITTHLEVETYTWEVLPKSIQVDLASSIEREMNWVHEHFSINVE